MALYQPIIVTPRPVTPPDLDDTRWRRFVDAIFFRRSLRQKLAMVRDELFAAYLEVGAANDRRSEGASAAHKGMFKIESLGVISSEVEIRKDHRTNERIATVRVMEMNNRAEGVFYERETVSFEGQAYIVKDVSFDDYHSDPMRTVTLVLQGVVLKQIG